MEKDEKEKVEVQEAPPVEETTEEKVSYRDQANKLYQEKNGIEARKEVITDEMLKGQDLNMLILIATGIIVVLFIIYLLFGKTNIVKNIFNKETPVEEEQKELIDNNIEHGVGINKKLEAYSTPKIVEDSCKTAEKDAITWHYCLDEEDNAIDVYAMNDLDGDVEVPSSFDGHKVISVGMYNSNRQRGICIAKVSCNRISSVVVPDGVLYIEKYFLANISGLQKVTLPNSIKYIGDYAFYDSPNIMSINSDETGTFNMPEDLEYYGTNLFVYNKYVTNFTFPDRIDYINSYTFDNCNTFRKLVITDQYKYILPGAFSNNDRLSSVTFEDGVYVIAGFANDTSLKEVDIADSVKYIHTKTFANDGNITSFKYDGKLFYLGTNIFGYSELDINDFITLKNLDLITMDEDEKAEVERKKQEEIDKERREREELDRKAREELDRAQNGE